MVAFIVHFVNKMSAAMSLRSSNRRLEGKVAIITGGASGIGASTVHLFHEHGAKIIIADIKDDQGQAVAEKLDKNVSYMHCDVSKEEDIIKLIDLTISKHGKLDIMYNNAGIMDRPLTGSTILNTQKADLEKMLSTNLIGAFLGAKHAARVMIPKRKGCILFTTSVCTSVAGISTHSYAASKYGIWGLANNLTPELGQYGIRVNCVSPYGLVSGMNGVDVNGEISGNQRHEAEIFLSEMGNLKGKILRANDVAKAALYLASDEADYVSGLNLVVDGGFSVVNPSLYLAASSRLLSDN